MSYSVDYSSSFRDEEYNAEVREQVFQFMKKMSIRPRKNGSAIMPPSIRDRTRERVTDSSACAITYLSPRVRRNKPAKRKRGIPSATYAKEPTLSCRKRQSSNSFRSLIPADNGRQTQSTLWIKSNCNRDSTMS